jgi:Zn-dependent peptidase ImmA (M78 family)/transcriptional regulator with XRE-family HTH domain
MAPRSIVALPTPELLVWARQTSGLDHENVAKKLKIESETIQLWEDGTEKPTLAQLRRLADIYKRPLAVFYLPERPKDFQPLRDFRRTAKGSDRHRLSPKLMLAIRNARDRREWALELYETLGEQPPRCDGTLRRNDDIDDAGEKLRKAIGIRFAQQSNWASAYEALKNWRTAIESAGILTFQASGVESTEARGFSISERPLPAVIANVKDTPRGRLFTLLHEVVHVMLNESGVCEITDGRHGSSAAELDEAFCNEVAGAALFPRKELLAIGAVTQHRHGDPNWTDGELQELSRKFGGSKEAALVRLLNLKLTTWNFYLEKREEFFKQYQKAQDSSTGFAAPHSVAVSNAGPTFTRLVLEGLSRNRITSSDFSDYLQIRVKHLAEVKQEVSQSSSRR